MSKQIKQTAYLVGTLFLLGVGASFVGAQTPTPSSVVEQNLGIGGSSSGAWTGPCGEPGTCNAPALLNVSGNSQEKPGPLRVGALRASFGAFVNYTDGNTGAALNLKETPYDFDGKGIRLGVNGKLATESICNEMGDKCLTWDTIYGGVIGEADGLLCPSTPNYSSMPNGPGLNGYLNTFAVTNASQAGEHAYARTEGTTDRWRAVSIPSSCKSDEGCVIRQKIYKRGAFNPGGFGAWSGWSQDSLYAVKDFEFTQTPTNTVDTTDAANDDKELWWSSYQTAGTYKNGDGTSSYVIKPYSYLYFRDDANPSGTADDEMNSDKWAMYDGTASWGYEIYVCSYDFGE